MEPLVGQILLFPYTYTPRGYAPCEGTLLRVADYPLLFSVIGIRFGGDGKVNFALPNYRSVAPQGSRYFIALTGRHIPA